METSKTITINEVTIDDKGKETVDEKEVTVKKMKGVKVFELISAVQDLPTKTIQNFSVEELENLTPQSFMLKTPALIAEAQDEVFNLLSVASGIEVKILESLYLEELIDVIDAILEINDISIIVNGLKKTWEKALGQVQVK